MRSFTVDVDGPVHVADFGGDGLPMALVHGLGGSHANWLSVGPRLARAYRVFAVDLPGFGLSPRAGRKSTIDANVRVLQGVLRRLDCGPAIVIGNSMGGLLSLGLAAVDPGALAGVVLVGAALPVPRRRPFSLEQVMREYVLVYFPAIATWRLRRVVSSHGPDVLVRSVLRQCTEHFDRIDPDVLQAHLDLERSRVSRAGWHEPLRDAVGSLLRTLAERSTVEGWIRQVSIPTLITHGRRDRVVSVRAAYAAADLRPDWDLHVFEDIGHLPMLEAPAEFVRVVQSWAERQPAYSHAAQADSAALAG